MVRATSGKQRSPWFIFVILGVLGAIGIAMGISSRRTVPGLANSRPLRTICIACWG